jgi:hypothetical protein
MKKGYHYTSAANWESIKTEGLIPYLIRKSEVEEYFPGGVQGVWLWANELKGLSHAGTVIFHAAKKATPNVVMLEVAYRERDVLCFAGDSARFLHDGHLHELVYHTDEPGIILTKPVPPGDIRLIAQYDLVELLA